MAATTALISLEEYMNTMYRPDCDYVNGEVQERNLGERDHATAQANLTIYLGVHRREWNIHVMTELRIRVGTNSVRLPDVCVMLTSAPYERVPTVPPFLCIEILSPSDNLVRVHKRIEDFLNFGVPYVWLIDTESRRAWVRTPEGETEALDGVLRAAQIEVPLSEIFE